MRELVAGVLAWALERLGVWVLTFSLGVWGLGAWGLAWDVSFGKTFHFSVQTTPKTMVHCGTWGGSHVRRSKPMGLKNESHDLTLGTRRFHPGSSRQGSAR